MLLVLFIIVLINCCYLVIFFIYFYYYYSLFYLASSSSTSGQQRTNSNHSHPCDAAKSAENISRSDSIFSAMAQNMMLYWGSGSPPCWRLMIALEEKLLQGYKHKHLSFDKKEHQCAEVKALNPRVQVRVLRVIIVLVYICNFNEASNLLF